MKKENLNGFKLQRPLNIFVSATSVCNMLCISRDTLSLWTQQGLLGAYYIPGGNRIVKRHPRYLLEDVELVKEVLSDYD